MQHILLGTEDWSFLGQVALRTFVMFSVILTGLRVMGKRGVKHLSVFELGVIVGLGSAAGDPMFYSDVGLLPCLVVFAVVLGLYRVLEYVMNRSEHAAERLEGRPVEVLRHGKLDIDAIDNIELTTPEIFAQLRMRCIAHLGQVERAIVEPNGELSVFFTPEVDIKPGLPIIPALHDQDVDVIASRATFSCRHCAHTMELDRGEVPACVRCGENNWTYALSGPRVT